LCRNLSVFDVTRQTRISPHLLEAIEAGQFERLPGQIYANSFIRQYARTLGLDEDQIIAAFQRQFADAQQACAEQEPSSPSVYSWNRPLLETLGRRLLGDTWLRLLVWLLATGAAGGYLYHSWANEVLPPASTAAAAGAPKISAPEKPPAPVMAPPEVQESVPPPAVHVALTASEPVWLSIKSDGTPAYTGTLETQETRQFDASRQMTVLVGNAGGLAVSVNGKPFGRIGDQGQVRVLDLTPEGGHVVPRKPPPAVPAPSPEDTH
jgi:cytoskeletal protein RodZ